MRKLGVGMVGYGFMGKTHTHGYKSIPMFYDPPPCEIELVGVCTAHADTAEAAARHGGYRFATTDLSELLERDDIDIIDCCTPNSSHRDVCVAALEAGKHVYCDKPLAMSLPQARDIVHAAENSPAYGQMAFNYRFVPAVMRARQLIDDGRLGRVFHFRAIYMHSGYVDPARPMSWRLDKRLAGGGALYDLGSHIVDLMRHLLGEYATVAASLETFINERPAAKGSSEMVQVEVDDWCLLRARMESGAVGTLEASRFATGYGDGLGFEIHGDKGALAFDLMQPNYLRFYDNSAPGGPIGGEKGFTYIACAHHYPPPAAPLAPGATLGWFRIHIACLHAFLQAIVDGREPSPGLRDGAATQAVLEAALQSDRQGGREVPVEAV